MTKSGIVPLFDASTMLEPATTEETPQALITRIADRVRDRHAREAEFRAYDHYLSWYWEERTVAVEIVDRVAKGGKEITVNITSLAPLNKPDFRCFFRGINTVAEYHLNASTNELAPNRYSVTISSNPSELRGLRRGDRMEFEFSPFLVAPQHGWANYYGTTMLYVVGRGIVPWRGVGPRLDSQPLPEAAWLGGHTTLGEHAATGAEWRTAPLWSIGLTAGVSGGESYLHDGRARSLSEAILWHGGEAEAAKELFRTMAAVDRDAILNFLKSL